MLLIYGFVVHRYGLELHIVSHEERFASFGDAVKVKNGVAVLGVLFHVCKYYIRNECIAFK